MTRNPAAKRAAAILHLRERCPRCSMPGVFIRTRYFSDGIADVWMCSHPPCPSHHIYWHVDHPRLGPNLPSVFALSPAVPNCDPPVAPHCSECAALRAQLAACRDALEDARPILKHAAVDGSALADEVLDRIAAALDQPAR